MDPKFLKVYLNVLFTKFHEIIVQNRQAGKEIPCSLEDSYSYMEPTAFTESMGVGIIIWKYLRNYKSYVSVATLYTYQ